MPKADKLTSMFTYIYLEKKIIRMKFRYIVYYVMIELVGELVSFAERQASYTLSALS